MNQDAATDRAARHLALPQVGPSGQARIADGCALIIGLGGIGCAVASYLTSSGIGRLMLCDFDTVDASNLGRQILYGPADVGRLKVEQAASRLAGINPDAQITRLPERLNDQAMREAVSRTDIVLDCCDNFATRFQVSDASVANRRCLISGAAIRFEGQMASFGPDYTSTPCYRCLYQEADESLENCAGNGVLSPVPGVIGSLMAVEALKFLAGIGLDSGRLSLYDGLAGDWRQVSISKRAACPSCGT